MFRERSRYSEFIEKEIKHSNMKEPSATKQRASLTYHFGIDFGTTNSATVAIIKGAAGIEAREVTFGDDMGRPIPSVVAIDKKSGQVYTGREAWDKKLELSESCEYISSIKTIIEKNEVFHIAGKEWTTTDIASRVFLGLKEKARNQHNVILSEATVAIPIGLAPEKRRKIREAAGKAGIEITSFVSEPTAAFYANYDELKSASNIAVFDWGGGTLDVSIISNINGKISEMATSGMNVAGDAIDKKIAERLHAKIARKKGKSVSYQDMPATARDMLRVRSERAKCMLSEDDTATVQINDYGVYGVCRETIDYDWFVDIIEPEVNNAIECLYEAIKQSGLGIANIDRVLMVGGSSNLRPLIEKMEDIFGDKLFFPDETAWNVARGAAKLNMLPGGYYSNQVIGIELSDGSFFPVLSKDKPVAGYKKEFNFSVVDDSRQARFLFGGSDDIVKSNERFCSVPAHGFLQESMHMTVTIDNDMVFRAFIQSRMHSDEYQRMWEYSRLKCYYRLPENY